MSLLKLTPKELRLLKGISFVGITTVFFCHDGKGNIFLTKRSNQTRDEHGCWDPGAGGLKHGQTLEENVVREILEEYDAEAKNIEFIGYRDVFRKSYSGQLTHWLAMDFAVLVDPVNVRINEPDMVDASGWFTLDTLPRPMHSQFELFMKKHGDTLKNILEN